MALYHTYRPQTFDQVIGQPHVTLTLKNMIKRSSISHAYLFCGPRGTGKTTVARVFAKAINCSGDDPPCNQCESCQTFNQGSLDLLEIDAASNTGVDMVRQVIGESAHFSPAEADYKVYVIDEAHMLSKQALNALLKTLEEPPKHAIFILATTERDRLIPTILSRCQHHRFGLISTKEIFKLIEYIAKEEYISIDMSALNLIAQQAEGCARDAVMLLDQMSTYEQITEDTVRNVLGIGDISVAVDFVSCLEDRDLAGGLEVVFNAVDSGVAPNKFVDQSVSFLHSALRCGLGNLSAKDVGEELYGRYSSVELAPYEISQMIRSLIAAKDDMKLVDPRTALSMHLVDIMGVQPVRAMSTMMVEKPKPALTKPVTEKPDPMKDPVVLEAIENGAEVVFTRLLDS